MVLILQSYKMSDLCDFWVAKYRYSFAQDGDLYTLEKLRRNSLTMLTFYVRNSG